MGKKAGQQPAAPKAPQAGGWEGRLHAAAAKFQHAANRAAARLEEVADRAASPLPSGRVRLWLFGFFHPEEAYERERNPSLSALFGNLLLFYFAYSAIFLAVTLMAAAALAPEEAAALGLQAPRDPLWSALGMLAANTAVSTVSVLFAFALVFVAAAALGGRGSYVRQSYAMSLVLCGSNVLLLGIVALALAAFVPAYLLRGVPLAAGIAALAAIAANVPLLLLCLAIILYTVYAYYLVVRRAHGFGAWRALGAVAAAAALVALADALLAWMMKT